MEITHARVDTSQQDASIDQEWTATTEHRHTSISVMRVVREWTIESRLVGKREGDQRKRREKGERRRDSQDCEEKSWREGRKGREERSRGEVAEAGEEEEEEETHYQAASTQSHSEAPVPALVRVVGLLLVPPYL